jgi:nucleotide-binding universal stress UspA family protein
MHRLLVAVDGSQQAERAVRYLIGLIREGGLLGGEREVHLINVQPQPSPRLTRMIPVDEFERYYQGQSDEACRAAEELLRAEGVPFTRHDRKGAAAETIVACARELQCDSIVMGTHGAGYISGILLGSVATKVIHLTEVPVTLVK